MPPYNPSTTLITYLNQWVSIASGGRVKLAGGMTLSGGAVHNNTGYFVFQCTECKDNWHVGHENFYGNVADPAAQTIPSVLSEWVKKHRHVCKKFNNPPAMSTGTCQSCKWPYGAHEQSWMGLPTTSGSQYAAFDKDGNIFGGIPGYDHAVHVSMTLKQFTGRKFRDAEVESLCESPDTNIEKTFNG